MNDDELTPEEKLQFDGLPKEASPSEFLWHRIVAPLRADGTLRRAAGRPPGLRQWVVVAASMAASVALFGTGVFVGHRMGSRSTERTLLAVREQVGAQLAQSVQETGTAYVSALVALSDLRLAEVSRNGPGSPGSSAKATSEIGQGREAALGALYGAAFELARIAPGDSDVSRILQVLEQRRHHGTDVDGAPRSAW